MFAVKNNALKPSFKYRQDELVSIAKLVYTVIATLTATIQEEIYPPWDRLPNSTRVWWVAEVKYRIDDPRGPVSDAFERWKETRVMDGWKYGKTLDDNKLTDPSLCAYAKLPKEVKAKYEVLAAIIDAQAGNTTPD